MNASKAKSKCKAKRKVKVQKKDLVMGPSLDKKLSQLSLELQQLILNHFQNSFPGCFGSELPSLLQEIKGHLFNRDFLAAFGKDEYLEAYAVRWSPSRALGYLEILHDVFGRWIQPEERGGKTEPKSFKTASLGGGAGAEIAALAGVLHLLRVPPDPAKSLSAQLSQPNTEDDALEKCGLYVDFNLTLVDIANWSSVVQRLHHGITTTPPLSQYASSAAKAANKPLLPPKDFQVSFHQADVLELSEQTLQDLIAEQDLITIFFTLNELYSTSMPKTQAFLLHLTEYTKTGALLLVVDSAGSYSTVSLKGNEKKYPMHWLLDHALLKPESRSKEGSGQWEKLQEEESRWFRIPNGLKYPLELENMRYQLHLYRRL